MQHIALVTGGVRGIGKAVTQELLQNNYRVIAGCHHSSSDPTDVPTYQWDVSNAGQCQSFVEKIEKDHGGIDVLVLNAGITRDVMLHKMSPESWEDVIRTNLSSAFYMTRAVISGMYERKYGRIILLSSVNAFKGQRGQTNYCAAKAGLLGFMKALALESIGKGVTVNAIAPGYTDTDMVRAVAAPILEKIVETIPAKRLATPEEIARCVAFLASKDSGYITGQTFHINGGMYFSS